MLQKLSMLLPLPPQHHQHHQHPERLGHELYSVEEGGDDAVDATPEKRQRQYLTASSTSSAFATSARFASPSQISFRAAEDAAGASDSDSVPGPDTAPTDSVMQTATAFATAAAQRGPHQEIMSVAAAENGGAHPHHHHHQHAGGARVPPGLPSGVSTSSNGGAMANALSNKPSGFHGNRGFQRVSSMAHRGGSSLMPSSTE